MKNKVIHRILHKILYGLPSSLVLMFHHVCTNPEIKCSECCISTEHFLEIIDKYVAYDSLDNIIRKKEHKKMAVTFDDGLSDVYTIAFPSLVQRKIPFTIYIATDLLDQPGYITKNQLVEMSKSEFVSVGAHGISHKILTGMSTDEKKKELDDSKSQLEKIIGQPVISFAYSHGQFDDEVVKLAQKVGYQYAVSTIARPLNITNYNKKYIIPRFDAEEKTYDSLLKLNI